MTLKTVAHQIYNLSVAGYINGIKFSKSEFTTALAMWMRGTDRYIIEVALPDGRWLVKITQYAPSADGYDYYVPATREQEEVIRKEI